MVTQKFTNICESAYVSRLIDQMNTEKGQELDDEKALRVLIDLTDELRRNKSYSPEHRELIFKEVDKRVVRQS